MPRFYDLQAWRRARREHLAQEPLCRMCRAQGITKPGHHVDHITPISKGGDPFDSDNLQSLCAEHHSLKTARDDGKVVRMGCDERGQPIDPHHHWARG